MSKRRKRPLKVVGPTSSVSMSDPETNARSKIVTESYVDLVKTAIAKCEHRKGSRCYVVGQVYATINNYGSEGADLVQQSFFVKRSSKQKLHECSSLNATVYYPLGIDRLKLRIHFEFKVFDENNNVPCEEIAFYLHNQITETTFRNLNRMIKSDDETLAKVAAECRRATLSSTDDLKALFKKD